jgi:hypothetical protein
MVPEILEAVREMESEAEHHVRLPANQLQAKMGPLMEQLRAKIQKLNELRVETQRSW